MFRGLQGRIRLLVLLAAMACWGAAAGQASADTAGTVHFVRTAESDFDSFTNSPTLGEQSWLREHMWRMIVYSPYFDERTSWYPQGWVYDDAYAIYAGSALATQHPEWILRDAAGNKLYIPWGCSGGSCPQYAGDISNPAFRQYWIQEAAARLAHGYRGLFIDDVNMEERTGNGEGQAVAPIDPNTGQPMSAAAWRAYMAQFMAEIRAAFPTAEIAHNAIWYANADAGTSDPSIRSEIESANYIFLERGVNDSGLTGGSGTWSLNALLSFIDQVHALGRGVVLDGTSAEPQGIEYNLASYFLISTGNDAVSAGGQTPENWWAGWNVNLGEATDGRYLWDNVLRRDYSGGMVLVNPPDSSTETISLSSPMQNLAGETVTSVTLPAAAGVVLTGNSGPTADASATSSPVPTQTTLQTTVIGSSAGSPAGAGSDGGGFVGQPLSAPNRRGPSSSARPRRQPTRRAHGRSRRSGGRRAVLARISGIVRRATRGAVAIGMEVRRDGRWVTAERLSTSLSASGRFARVVPLKAGGRYRLRALYAGSNGYQPSHSAYRMVVTHAR